MMEYLFSLNFLVHIAVSVVILWVSTSLGKILMSYASGYQPIASLLTREDSNIGFNAIYRILFTPVSVVVTAVIIYSFGLEKFIAYIWLIAVYVFILQFLLVVVLGRWKLMNKGKFFLFHGIAILLSYYLYAAAISKGLSHLLPDEQSLRTELWFIIALFLYGVFKNIPENSKNSTSRKERYIQSKAKYFRKKYTFDLDKYDETLAEMLIAIMVYENFNRPLIIRTIENLTSSNTRYVMQVYGAKSDLDSIKITADSLKTSYEEFKNTNFTNEWEKYNSLQKIFSVHNPGDNSYAGRVHEIYRIITKP